MARIKLCGVLFAVLVVFSVTMFFKTDSELGTVSRLIDETARFYGQGKKAEAEQASRNARAAWEKFERCEFLLADKSNMVEITILIAQIESGIYENQAEVLSECETLGMVLTAFRNKQKQIL